MHTAWLTWEKLIGNNKQPKVHLQSILKSMVSHSGRYRADEYIDLHLDKCLCSKKCARLQFNLKGVKNGMLLP
ncbi:hypothetical protein MKY07_02730 [Solibacillus sp. FSL W7-1472]|uniref:hypothetical protein n=1 Tax=Solibacillus sp. FSL W7-1472 TaxID=2921707 RepID=UPI0030D7A077